MENKLGEANHPSNGHTVVVTLTNGRSFALTLEHLLSRAMCIQQKRDLLRVASHPALPGAEEAD